MRPPGEPLLPGTVFFAHQAAVKRIVFNREQTGGEHPLLKKPAFCVQPVEPARVERADARPEDVQVRARHYADRVNLQVVDPAYGGEDVGFESRAVGRVGQTLRGEHQSARLWK